MVLPEYREEMVGVLGRLRDMVLEGKLTPGMFEKAERRLYWTYMTASVRRVAERMG